jgi:hypothetical protein
VEKPAHARAHGLVVGVEGAGVLWSSSLPTLLGRSEEGFNGFVAENDQRRHCSSPLGNGFVFCRLADAADDLFPAKFFQIVGGTTWSLLGFSLPTQPSHLFSQLGGGEPPGEGESANTACATQRMRALLKPIPPTLVLPTCAGAGSCSRVSSAMKH